MDKDIIKVNNNIQALVTAKGQYGFSESRENPRSHSHPKGKIRSVFPNKLKIDDDP